LNQPCLEKAVSALVRKDEETMTPQEPATTRLIPALPASEFVEKPEEIDRLIVRLLPDGTLYFRGLRQRVEEFLEVCAAAGLELHVDHIALCG
jgi:hypothetical protein